MANLLDDCFYDCESENESETDSSRLSFEERNCDRILREVGGYSPDHQLLLPNSDDRKTLERVANISRLLLRSIGGKCDCYEHVQQQTSHSFFYPATLEICARLLTDKSTPSPPCGQCRLRGDPITLKLPMELNPYNGQVNLNIFQPDTKSLAVTGGSQCAGAGDRRSEAEATSDIDSKLVTQAEVGLDTGLDTGLGHGAVQRPGFGLSPGGMRRYTQRHDGVQKTGRKVRWPDVM